MTKRKMSENSLKNLEKRRQFSKDDVDFAKKAQMRSTEKKREKKMLKELLKMVLDMQDEETGEKNSLTITKALIEKATKGDVSAYQTIRDTIGEKPVDKQEIVDKTVEIVVANQKDADLIKEIQDVKPDEDIL